MLDINPWLLYKCTKEFKIIIEQYNIDMEGITESWSRDSLPLDEVIIIENFKIVTNIVRCQKRGGSPTLVIKKAITS